GWLLDSELYERGWDEGFEGEIIGVIGSGLFARFGEVFEGFLPARHLSGDYFQLHDLGSALVGRRGGGPFRLGGPGAAMVELLLHRREIDSLIGAVNQKGLTLVPTRLYFKNGRAKLEVALARGKEQRDKRRDIAKRDAQRDIERALRRRR